MFTDNTWVQLDLGDGRNLYPGKPCHKGGAFHSLHGSRDGSYTRKQTQLNPVVATVPLAVVTWDLLLQWECSL